MLQMGWWTRFALLRGWWLPALAGAVVRSCFDSLRFNFFLMVRFHRRRLSLRQALAITLLLSIAMLYYSIHSTQVFVLLLLSRWSHFKLQGVARPKVVTELKSREFCAIDKESLLEEPDDLDNWASNQVTQLPRLTSPSECFHFTGSCSCVHLKWQCRQRSQGATWSCEVEIQSSEFKMWQWFMCFFS